MEASRFGFGADMPPAFKFDPTDADIVAHYLLPRALGLPTPHAHAVIDDDPSSLPPWELLRRHGHGGSSHAFFFGRSADRSQKGGRKNRAVKGGTWQGQKAVEETVTLLLPGGGGGEVDVRYKRYNLTFCRGKRSGSTGFVMHEYEIVSPPLPGAVLTRVKVTRKGKHRMQLQQQQAEAEAETLAAADQQIIPVLEQQPGPSYYHAAVPVPPGDGEAFGGGQDVALYGDNGAGMVETGAYYAPPLYVPEGGDAGEYNNYYCQHQQVLPWPYQLDPSYQYHAGNVAVVGAGEGCSGWQQTCALNAYGDTGGAMGETGGHCSASLCGAGAGAGAGDDDCDVDSYYDALFGDEDIKLEQNGVSASATDRG